MFDLSNVFHNYIKFVSPAVKLSHHGRRSGGVIVLVKQDLSKFIEKIEVECKNVIFLKLSKELFGSEKDVLYISTYIPPHGSPFYDQSDYECHILEVERHINDLMDIHEDTDIILNGDFNARTGDMQVSQEFNCSDADWDDLDKSDMFESSRLSEDSDVNDFGKILLEMCACYDLELLNGCIRLKGSGNFTYLSDHGHSVVDYYLTSSCFSKHVEKLIVKERIDSDHMPVEMYCQFIGQNYLSPNVNEQVRVEKFFWSVNNLSTFVNCISSNAFLEQIKEATDLIDCDLEASLSLFTESLLNAAVSMKKTVVRGGSRKYRQAKWFDAECHAKKKEVKRCLKLFKKNGHSVDYDEYAKHRREYKALLKNKKSVDKKADIANLLESANDSKAFWGEVRKHRRRKFIGNDITDREWIQHFENVFNEGFDTDEDIADLDRDEETVDDILDAEISEVEISKAIKHLKGGKSAGLDGILAEMLKAAEIQIIPYLKNYFNALFSNSQFPIEWTKAIIFPLHKKGDTNNPDNYRGISLLSILSKVFTHVINSRLTLWAETNLILSDAQAGFRKGRSTIDHIFTLHAAIEKHMAKNTKLYVAFIDFKKAYDRVNRKILWLVLFRTGIQGRMLRMLRAMYASVQACVVCNTQSGHSEFFECLQGLKQGCIVSPILFSLLINELANEIILKGRHGVSLGPNEIELFLLLFADDLTLLASTIIGLQNQLNVLEATAQKLGLSVNLDKSKIIVFRKGGYLAAKEKWVLDGSYLDVVNSYKYLGLTFSTRHSFTAAMEDATIRAKKSTMEILNTLKRIGCNSADVFFKLFDAQVVPKLLYGAEIWGYRKYDQIEQVHLFACKRLLRIQNKTPNDVVYGELGRFPIWITACIKCIKYWFRLLKQGETMYSKKAYNMLFLMHQNGHVTWVTYVREVLCANGFEQVWLFGCGNEKDFFKELKERLQSSFYHGWRNHIESSEKMLTYGKVKTFFEREKYVGVIWIEAYRNALAQFRMGISQINAHKYRFSAKESTACPFCPEKVESEIHFLFECPTYNQLRRNYLHDSVAGSDFQKIKWLLTNDSPKVIVNTAKFLFFAFKLRAANLNV